ncbi:MAG: hypothetical protein ACK559_04065, partial [bacterium]
MKRLSQPMTSHSSMCLPEVTFRFVLLAPARQPQPLQPPAVASLPSSGASWDACDPFELQCMDRQAP